MQSIDEFTPSTTEPVFGSGLIHTKLSQQVNNNTNESEQVETTSEMIVNGKCDTDANKNVTNESTANGTTESNNEHNVDVNGASSVHANGQDDKSVAIVVPSVIDGEAKTSETSISNSQFHEEKLQAETSTSSTAPASTVSESIDKTSSNVTAEEPVQPPSLPSSTSTSTSTPSALPVDTPPAKDEVSATSVSEMSGRKGKVRFKECSIMSIGC
jgi:hypothetical protein